MEPRTHARKQTLAAGALALAALLLPPVSLPAAPETREVVDETGRRVKVPARVERIVSLAPNLTEMVYALELEDRLVGVTRQCDYPPDAQRKPAVGDVVNPSIEKIVALQPDVVLGTEEGNRWATVKKLEEVGIPLYGVAPGNVEGIFASIRHVAELAGVPERGRRLVARLRARLKGAQANQPPAARPRVLFIVWLEPLITAGGDTFLNDVLRRAGARSVTADLDQDWPRLSLEEAIERDPDYLVLPRTAVLEAATERVFQKDPWRGLPAVEQDRVVWISPKVLRPGPRIVQAVEELAGALQARPARAVKAEK